MNRRYPTDIANAGEAVPARYQDQPVAIEELRASSRVRFWVPPQLMGEFFGPPLHGAAVPHPPTDLDAYDCAQTAFVCVAAR